MFRLGKQVESALLALKALNEAQGKEVSISDICSKYGLSKNTLSKIMQSLSSHKIIESAQGARGGYRLSHPLAQTSFYQVLDSLGEIRHLSCRAGQTCTLTENCSISSPLAKWEKQFEDYLKATMLGTLLYNSHDSPSAETASLSTPTLPTAEKGVSPCL